MSKIITILFLLIIIVNGETATPHPNTLPFSSTSIPSLEIKSDTTIPEQPKKERLKFFEWLTNAGKDKVYKERWRTALDGTPPCAFSGELKTNARWAERYPVSTKVLQVIIEEGCGASVEKLLPLSRKAIEDWERLDLKTAKDDKIFSKMNKYSKRSSSTIGQAINGDLWTWLNQKEKAITDNYTNKKRALLATKEELLRDKSKNDKSINAIKDSVRIINRTVKEKVNALKDVRTQLTNKEATLSDTTSYSIDFNIPNIEITSKDYSALKAALDCINQNQQSNQSCLDALPNKLKLVLVESESCNKGLIKLSDPLGNPCPEDRANLIKDFFPMLIGQLKNIPAEYLEKVTVEATFTGKADLTSFGKKIKPKDVPETINQTYYNHKNQIITFDKSAGVQTITNEELAFLRAYCTYTPVRDILLTSSNNLIDLTDTDKHQVTFVALEQQKGSKEKREDFRGGQFQICFNGLYDGMIEDIEKIKATESKLVAEMKALKDKKEQLLDEIEAMGIKNGEFDTRIDNIDLQIYQIDKILNKQ